MVLIITEEENLVKRELGLPLNWTKRSSLSRRGIIFPPFMLQPFTDKIMITTDWSGTKTSKFSSEEMVLDVF